MRSLIIATITLLPSTALAHAGHATEGTTNHAIEHFAVLGVAMIAGLVATIALRTREVSRAS